MGKSIKVSSLFLAFFAAASLCSCGKEDTSWRDALLNDVSGEYYLVGYDWQGAPVDVYGDGESSNALLPVFLGKDRDVFKLSVTVRSDVSREGTASGPLPSAAKSVYNEYPSSWRSTLNFKYDVGKSGLSFSGVSVDYGFHADHEILTQLTEPRVEFTRDLHSDEIRYLTVNCVAKVYDQSTRRYVDGTVTLKYVTSPRVTVEDYVVTVQGATADGMVTYTYDLKTGK